MYLAFQDDAGNLGTGTQIGFCKTSQEDLCLLEGWKSNVSQQKVREEFAEDVERADYAERNKSSRESQVSYGFTYLWSITNNMEDKGRWRREGS